MCDEEIPGGDPTRHLSQELKEREEFEATKESEKIKETMNKRGIEHLSDKTLTEIVDNLNDDFTPSQRRAAFDEISKRTPQP